MDKKSDLRVIKTRKIIFQTLLELMKEKTFEEEISILTNSLKRKKLFK